MCLIIADVDTVGVPVEHFRLAWNSNKDGAGVMYWDSDGKLQVVKGIMTLDELLKVLEPLNGHCQFAVHFRFATHGGVSPELTHPFDIGQGSYLMHNGVVDCPKFWDGSDTSFLADGMKTRCKSEGDLLSYMKFLDETEYGSKFILFTPDHYQMAGRWHKENGVYYSNLYSCSLVREEPKKIGFSKSESKSLMLNFVLNPRDFEIGKELAKDIADELFNEEGWIVDVVDDNYTISSTDLAFIEAVETLVNEARAL